MPCSDRWEFCLDKKGSTALTTSRAIPWGCLFALALLPAMAGGVIAEETPVVFQTDVMAVLSKAGCNLGTCHGNKHGKGGFRLSLRGQSPEQDYKELTRAFTARRINPLDASDSLILKKPTLAVPHQGGKRFEVDSPEYRILQSWIKAGAPPSDASAATLESLTVTPKEAVLFDPEDQIQLTASAAFLDGSRRDVTRLAVFEAAQPLSRTSSPRAVGFSSACGRLRLAGDVCEQPDR